MKMDIENIKKYKKMSVDDSNPWIDTCGMLYDAIFTWGGQDSHDDWWKTIKFDKTKKITYNNSVEKKEENNSMFDTANMMSRYFGKIATGMVRMSMNGDMAIKTSNGYKTYDVATGALVNCDNFAFDVGSEFFFIIPTNKLEAGDVILTANKQPHCVIKVEPNRIEALRYEDGSIITIVPERNVMFGRTYFYGKVVSMFGKVTDDKGMKNMMKYFIMSEMMGKNSGNSNVNSMLPMMLFMGNSNMEDMFEGMFDFSSKEDEKVTEEN